MKREFDSSPQTPDPAVQAELSIAAIEASSNFRTSPRHRALLRYLVERALAGDHAALKETVIAVEVFGRPAARFDPKADSIVRVEARRLRARLAGFYGGQGRDASLRIELPVGSYVPQFAWTEPVEQPDEAARRARDLIERGEHFLRQALSRRTLETALERFDAALRIAPQSAEACVGMARAWLNLATGWYHDPRIACDHAAEALRRALELDPEHAIAHTLLGAIQNQFERDWPAAEKSFRRAIALTPRDAFVHSAFGAHLFMRGEFERAERELAMARSIDPQYVNMRAHMINLRLAQGRLDDAGAEIEAMLDIAPTSISANGLAAVLALVRGDAHGASERYASLREAHPDHPGCVAALAAARAAAGDVDGSDALLAELHERFTDHVVSPYILAVVATHAGRTDLAFSLIDRADEERDPSALTTPIDMSFVRLHGDPRWPTLVARLRATRPRRRRA